MRPSRKIPTIFGLFLLVLGVGAGVYATQFSTIFKLGAIADTKPQDVRISNVTDNSFTVSWITDKDATGFLSYGTDTSLGRTQTPDSSGLKQVHSISVRNLTASTTYFFKINSAGSEYDSDGIAWQVQTTTKQTAAQNPGVISGNVSTSTGEPASEVLVYVNADNLAQLSVKTSTNGSFLIPLSTARSINNQSLAVLNDQSLLQIFVQGGQKGVSTATVFFKSANPIPPITLGETHDFRTIEAINNSTTPESEFDVSVSTDEAELKSKFDLGEVSSPTNATVTLESVTDGEIISTNSPEFFGDGPPGVSLTITVHSDPVSGQAKVAQNGNWRWSPPKDLPEGEHKVTITWKDAAGILRQLERSFIVSAQEGPAFESTPSGVTPRPSPTPTIKPSPSPVASASATPTSTPRLSVPSTDSGTPIAGSLTPTLLLSIMGIGLLAFGIYVSIKASS